MLCDCLTVAFDAIILSKLLCASSACFSVEHLSMMPKNSYRSIQMESLYSCLYRASELFSTRYCRLFKTTCVIRHIVCINNLLPPVGKVPYVLRDRGHPYELTEHKYHKTKCSYIVRSIFDHTLTR